MNRYTLGIKAPGRGYREARAIDSSKNRIKEFCNLVLEHGTEVTFLKVEPATKIQSKCCDYCTREATYKINGHTMCTCCATA